MNLYKISKDLWAFNYKDRKAILIEGLPELFVVSQQLEIPMNEMETALIELEKNDHNLAEFGVWNRSFTITRKV